MSVLEQTVLQQVFNAGAPANTVAPVVTGTKRRTYVLTTTNGTWTGSGITYSYQWQRDVAGNSSYSNISAATASTYTLAGADIGNNVRCRVTATDSGGATTASSNVMGLIGAFTSITPANNGIELCSDGILVNSQTAQVIPSVVQSTSTSMPIPLLVHPYS